MNTETDSTPIPAAADETEERLFSLKEMEEAVARADNEGYLRGRNEQIAAKMNEPGLFETPGTPVEPAESGDEEPFLRYIRPSVWD